MGVKFPVKYGSHLPVLIKLMGITSGDVLEMGVGFYSTPYLHWACFEKKRHLVTYENDPEYYRLFSEFASDFHQVTLVDDWDKADIEKTWDIALIDHAPAGRRIVDIRRLSIYTKYVIIHDTSWKQEHNYHYNDIWSYFKYRWDYKPMSTCTTVVSNFVDLKGFAL